MGTESYSYLDTAALTSIRATHRKNLAVLTDQASKFGELHVPVHIKNQIDSEIAAVDVVNRELARHGISSDDPPPGSAVGTVINHYYGTTIVGDRGVAIGGNTDNAQISTGDNNRLVRDSPGYIEQANAVQQDFSQHAVTTVGEAAAHDGSKATTATSRSTATLRTLIAQVQAAATEAQSGNDEELGDTLQTVAIQLRDARRKIVEAQKILQALSTTHPTVTPLLQSITQVSEQ